MVETPYLKLAWIEAQNYSIVEFNVLCPEQSVHMLRLYGETMSEITLHSFQEEIKLFSRSAYYIHSLCSPL